MQIGAQRIWVTRTQPDAEATASRLRALGHKPLVAPVLASRPTPNADIASADLDLTAIDALAFTSAAAVRAFADLSPVRDLPVFAVGASTAGAAREAGFGAVLAAGGNVHRLAAAIVEAKPGHVLIPTARAPAADLVALLADQGVASRSLVVYETVATQVAAPDPIDAILIHSPRSARIVAGLIAPARAAKLAVFAISEAAAAPLRALPFASISIATFPDEASLLDLLQA